MAPRSRRPPRVLVLWAEESSPNLGVAVLARGSHDLLRRAFPAADFTFANYGARPPQVPWGRPRSLLRERLLPRYGMQEFFTLPEKVVATVGTRESVNAHAAVMQGRTSLDAVVDLLQERS